MRPPIHVEVGTSFGRWTVIAEPQSGYREKAGRWVLCRCRCGTEGMVAVYLLANGTAIACRSCGIRKHWFEAGDRFGSWTVLVGSQRGDAGVLICRCDCGNLGNVTANALLDPARSHSCPGCSQRVHGGSGTRLYSTWLGMHGRCHNDKAPYFYRYGGRGISVCDEWSDFAVFREWAQSHGYTDELTIDRVNNDGNYEASNCEWVTRSENSRRAMVHRWRRHHEQSSMARRAPDDVS